WPAGASQQPPAEVGGPNSPAAEALHALASLERGAPAAQLRPFTLPPKDRHLSSQLARLAQESEALEARGEEVTALYSSSLSAELRSALRAGLMHIDGDGRVQVYVQSAGQTSPVTAQVSGAGGEVERVDERRGIVQAEVPIGRLRAVSANDSVKFIRLPTYAHVQAGSATTQGDSILKALQTRTN